MKRTITIALGALALGGFLAMPQIGYAQMNNMGNGMGMGGSGNGMMKGRPGHHPVIHRAINHLEQTKRMLDSDTIDDFGGHKKNAEALIDQAIAQLRLGDQSANVKHGQ